MHGLPHFTEDWFTPAIPLWEKILQPYAGKPNISMLEIGSFEGRCACWLLEHILTHPSSTLTCIDTFQGEPYHPADESYSDRFDANIACTGATNRVHKLNGRSEEILRTLPFNTFDCIYIDGGHRCTFVLRDAVLAWDDLKIDGLMIFDDYLWPRYPAESKDHPKRGIDAFLAVYAEELEIVHEGYQVVIRKCAPNT